MINQEYPTIISSLTEHHQKIVPALIDLDLQSARETLSGNPTKKLHFYGWFLSFRQTTKKLLKQDALREDERIENWSKILPSIDSLVMKKCPNRIHKNAPSCLIIISSEIFNQERYSWFTACESLASGSEHWGCETELPNIWFRSLDFMLWLNELNCNLEACCEYWQIYCIGRYQKRHR